MAAWKAKKLRDAALDPDLARVSSVSWSVGAMGDRGLGNWAITTLVALPTQDPLQIITGRDGFAADHQVTLIVGDGAEAKLLRCFWASLRRL